MSQLKIGIVGFPNVGKSTLFNALLKQQVALAANYPFATVEPNVGIAEVPDDRLQKLAALVKTTTIKPATVEFVDIAGLVRGASKGEGLGNQFLAHIRETSAICHVVRGFSDESVLREGATDPKSDLEAIRLELVLADLTTLQKQAAPKGTKEPKAMERWHTIQKFLQAAEDGLGINTLSLDEDELLIAKELGLLTAKSEIVVINVDEGAVKSAAELQTKYAHELGLDQNQVVIISAKIESELASLAEEDQALFMEELGVSESGLERLAKVAYQTLNLQSFLTAGEKEVRAWTIKAGTTAPQAAGVIHTDFEKHFIKANIASYGDFVECGGWKGVKEKGKLRLEGRDYVMREGDVVEFMIGK